jgi:pimeloyl-ACP methyl ester carboxylesterase
MRTLAPFAFAQDVDPSLLQSFIDKKARDVQDPIGYRAQIDAVLAHDTAGRLGLIRAPTLVLTGDDDQVIPGESSQLLVERIPNATLRIVPGTGHLFFAEQPEETIEILAGFLGSDASRARGQLVDAP